MLDSRFHHRGRDIKVNLFGHAPVMGVVRKLCATPPSCSCQFNRKKEEEEDEEEEEEG
ncbi:hypothetical protein INR49_011811, partial [Caranx melampygus]